ncbi:MAG: FUSC family protein [Chthoniobacteraceae bacterium]
MEAATIAFAPAARVGWFDWLRRELAPFPGREAMTFRIVVAVVLVVIISMTLQIPEVALSAYMVLFVTKENKIVTALTGILLIVGVTIGIAASLFVYRFTFDFPELRIPGMALVVFSGFYFSRVFIIGPLAFAIGFVIAATQTVAELMPSMEYLVHFLLWLWVAIAYPIAITVLVNQFLLPAHPRTALVRGLQRRIDATMGLIDRKLGLVPPDERAGIALQELASRGSAGLFKLLTIAGIADPQIKRQHMAKSAVIMATERLVTASAAFALREGEPLAPDDRRRLEALRAEIAALRTALVQHPAMPHQTEARVAAATLPEIRELQHATALLRDSLKAEIAGSAGPASPPKQRKRLLAADAFTNPAHVHFALKVTLAAMTCYIIYTGLDWAGIHTAFITCCIISLESTGATLSKGALRLAGCAIGGLLGFLSVMYLLPLMESITSLVLLVAVVTAFAGWVAAGSERISYAGLQIALAFNMTMFQGFAPGVDFNEIRDRLVGIILGITVITLVFHYLWPERATDRLREKLVLVLRNVARLLTISRQQTSLEAATAEAGNLRAEITASLDKTFQLAEVDVFESDETAPANRVSAPTMEAIATQAQGIFLTANLLAQDDAPVEWHHLSEPAQQAEEELRKAAAAQLDRAAGFLMDGMLGEKIDIETQLAAWNRATASLPDTPDGHATLLRHLVAQIEEIDRLLKIATISPLI